jgi:hypothetical protein
MVSAALPSPQQSTAAPPSTQALAAAGHFRAIALWLNKPLIPQGFYAQVRSDRPGCLTILVEFQHPPAPETFTRFICHRIWQLNSPLIEGIHLITRPIGSTQMLWEKRVRVVTPARRQRQRTSSASRPPLPPTLKTPRRRPSQKSFAPQQIKTLRAFMLSGSAVAAFVFGCLIEVILAAGSGPTLPMQKAADPAPIPFPAAPASTALPISYSPPAAEARPARPPVVNTATEPVVVIDHRRLPQPTDPTVTLVFGGDVTLQGLPYGSFENDGQLLSGVSVYQEADVAVVSLDTPLATAATSLEEEFIQRQRPDAIALLKAGGVDMVNLASASTLTHGEQGLAETLDTLDSNGIYRIGAGRNEQEARRPEILDVKGQRIAFLSYNQADLRAAHGDIGGVNGLIKQRLIEDIRALRKEVDWLVVNYRWQEELPEKAADWQTNLARLAIDQGADLVVGYHPQQLQGAEVYKGRPIAYSLGDFVFSDAAQASEDTAMLKVSLRDRQMKVELLPVVVKNSQPQQVGGAEGKAILDKIQLASQGYDAPMAATVVLEASPRNTEMPAPLPDASPSDSNTFVEPSPILEQSPLWDEEVPSEKEFQVAPAPNGLDNELEMEPIPDGLLDDWGTKTEPAEPDFIPIPAEPQSPALNPVDARPPVPTAPTPIPVSHQETDAIGPYSEPLIGPLGSRPRSGSSPLWEPQTRILKPHKVTPMEAATAIPIPAVEMVAQAKDAGALHP